MGTTKVGKMVEKIIEKGDHGEQFQRYFVLHIISLLISGVLYLDRVVSRGKRCKDRWFLIFIGEHGRGKIIDRIEYQKIIHESEIELQTKSAHITEDHQAHTETSTATHSSPPAAEQPRLECGSEREHLTAGTNNPIENTGDDGGRCLCNGNIAYRSVRSTSSLDMRTNK
ncbi:hypothetical protein Cgig2_028158 [Carnegiea gigantea]|uniref:Uncharacterized protein n=1 Tax=Carnegiea gigantea TaxID=171969 RepID=A0A9Q1JYM5_9CARY|nr:hypothetical protein Cgig2_028158 [Carnegiea gigantea]